MRVTELPFLAHVPSEISWNAVCKFGIHISRTAIREEGIIVKEIGFALVTGAALMATTAISDAQGTATRPESNGTASGLCWDVNAGMILPDYRSTLGSAPSANPGSTVGSALPSDPGSTVGSALSADSGRTNSTFSKDAAGLDNPRPAGIPDC